MPPPRMPPSESAPKGLALVIRADGYGVGSLHTYVPGTAAFGGQGAPVIVHGAACKPSARLVQLWLGCFLQGDLTWGIPSPVTSLNKSCRKTNVVLKENNIKQSNNNSLFEQSTAGAQYKQQTHISKLPIDMNNTSP